MAEKKKAAPKAAKEKQANTEPKKATTAIVSLPPQYGALNVRNKPNGQIVGTLANGKSIEVLDTVQHNGEHWVQIGETRYVNAAFLKTE